MNNKNIEDAIESGILKAALIILKAMRNGLITSLITFLIVSVTIDFFSCKYDKNSTDSAAGRSGLKLHVDNKTGCHYLSTSVGGIIKRTDINGSHLCDAL